MPNGSAFYTTFVKVVNYLIVIEYKKILISFSYIYYATVFFIIVRVLVYCGLTLISLINTKHTTALKQKSFRSLFGVFLKFYKNNSFKNIFLKLVTVNCL